MSPIVDLIIRIKNGYLSRRATVVSPYSKFREAVVKKLELLGFIQNYEVTGDQVKTMTINLRYEEGEPALTEVKLFSKPGRRWYITVKELKPVLGNMGYAFISTPKGILTNREAKKEQVGGELLFHIW